MRIISGQAKGRRLSAPKSLAVRPTTARVRKSLFDIIEARFELRDAVVLDLFAGSGALGIEALSRGASFADFVDVSNKSISAIRENLRNLDLGSCASLHRSDARTYLARTSFDPERYDLVFCDPPYDFSDWGSLFQLLPKKAVIIVEAQSQLFMQGWCVVTFRNYGSTVVTVMTADKTEAEKATKVRL